MQMLSTITTAAAEAEASKLDKCLVFLIYLVVLYCNSEEVK